MINANINNTIIKKRVLVAPLDWGLGHATRCIPVINALIVKGFEVVLAGDNAVESLLKKEFPSITFLFLEGYKVVYGKSKATFWVKMIQQLPKIKAAIKNENEWLNKTVKEHKIDIVISDNRFGLYNKNVKCIFITHQLNIQMGNKFFNKIAQKINYHFINKFEECWVPDIAGENSLAGILSHPKKMPNTVVKYIGVLSRFTKNKTAKNVDVVVLLSGPEPQRTIFETIILKQIENTNLKIKIARGLPSSKKDLLVGNKNVEIINHLPKDELSALIKSAKIVIARSGYSTVMDMAALQQATLYVPTPGQTEQEYLAKYLSEKKYCFTTSQATFNFEDELKKLDGIVFRAYPENNNVALEQAIANLNVSTIYLTPIPLQRRGN